MPKKILAIAGPVAIGTLFFVLSLSMPLFADDGFPCGSEVFDTQAQPIALPLDKRRLIISETVDQQISEFGWKTRLPLYLFKEWIRLSSEEGCQKAEACSVREIQEITKRVVLEYGDRADQAKAFFALSSALGVALFVSNEISQIVPDEYQFFSQVLAIANAMGIAALGYRYSFPIIEQLKKWSHKTEKTALKDPYDSNQTLAQVRYRNEERMGTIDSWGRSIIIDGISLYTPRLMMIIEALHLKKIDYAAENMAHLIAGMKDQFPDISPHQKDLASAMWGVFPLDKEEVPKFIENVLARLIRVHPVHQKSQLDLTQDDIAFFYQPLLHHWFYPGDVTAADK